MSRPGGVTLRAGWPGQALLFAAAYLAYAHRGGPPAATTAAAVEHAHWIVELEQAIGVAVEASVQRALDGTAVLWLLNHAYLAAQAVVVPAALIWLYRRDRERYRLLRDTVLITWLIALPVFGLFPVAPPRLADLGIVDTISQQTGLALDSKLTTSFYNPLAAVPSLHCGFALAVSVTLGGAATHRWSRALALGGRPRSSSRLSRPATTTSSTSSPGSPSRERVTPSHSGLPLITVRPLTPAHANGRC